MARLVTVDNGTGRERVRHATSAVQVLLVLRLEPQDGRGEDQPDLRTGQVDAAQRRAGLYGGGGTYVRCAAGTKIHNHILQGRKLFRVFFEHFVLKYSRKYVSNIFGLQIIRK